MRKKYVPEISDRYKSILIILEKWTEPRAFQKIMKSNYCKYFVTHFVIIIHIKQQKEEKQKGILE